MMRYGYQHCVGPRCQVVAIMPSYAEVVPGEVKQVTAPTQVLWAKGDQFHSWKKFKPLADTLAASLGKKFSSWVFDAAGYTLGSNYDHAQGALLVMQCCAKVPYSYRRN